MNRREGLIARARTGDRAAFDSLATEASPSLESYIVSELGEALLRKMSVEDVRQEALLGAWRSIDDFRGHDWKAFHGWLRGIAGRVILDAAKRYRAQKRAVDREVPLVTSSSSTACGPSASPAADPTPSRHAARVERLQRLRTALSQLSPEHRRVIVLARIEELPVKEVARRMGRSADATSMLLLRALRKLREAFGDTKSFNLPEDARLVLDDLGADREQ